MSAPIIIGKWSDVEKVALLLSVIRGLGSTPNWKGTALPAGRTMQATQKMYSELIKTTAGVRMVGGQDITPSRKMPRGGGTVSIRPARATGEKPKGNNAAMKQANGNGSNDATKSKKRSRDKHDYTEDESGDGAEDEDDEEDGEHKKIKVESVAEEFDIIA